MVFALLNLLSSGFSSACRVHSMVSTVCPQFFCSQCFLSSVLRVACDVISLDVTLAQVSECKKRLHKISLHAQMWAEVIISYLCYYLLLSWRFPEVSPCLLFFVLFLTCCFWNFVSASFVLHLFLRLFFAILRLHIVSCFYVFRFAFLLAFICFVILTHAFAFVLTNLCFPCFYTVFLRFCFRKFVIFLFFFSFLFFCICS